MLFGGVVAAIINLKGLELVMSTIFGIDPTWVVVIGGCTVLLYSVFGGMWTTATTGTIQTFMIVIPAAIVIPLAISKVGGTGAIGQAMDDSPADFSNIFSHAGAVQFGILVMMGNFAFCLADQPYWQKIWSIKRRRLEPSLFWSGAWYWPIPMSLAILGLVTLTMGADVNKDLGGDVGNAGPFAIANLDLPLYAIIGYALVIIAACYSSMDGGFSAIASIFAVDIAGTYSPRMRPRTLFWLTKVSMVAGAAIAMAIVLSGIDLVPLVLVLYALKLSVLFPLLLAILWPRMTAWGSFIGIIAAIAIGMPVYQWHSNWSGTWLVMGISIVVPIIVSLLQKEEFDYSTLTVRDEMLAGVTERGGASVAESHGVTAQPVRIEEQALPAGTVYFYIAGAAGSVVISTIVIGLIPSYPGLLYLAPVGAVALTLFLIGLFVHEYREAKEERAMGLSADQSSPASTVEVD
jgi:Na+/proline symporter